MKSCRLLAVSLEQPFGLIGILNSCFVRLLSIIAGTLCVGLRLFSDGVLFRDFVPLLLVLLPLDVLGGVSLLCGRNGKCVLGRKVSVQTCASWLNTGFTPWLFYGLLGAGRKPWLDRKQSY